MVGCPYAVGADFNAKTDCDKAHHPNEHYQAKSSFENIYHRGSDSTGLFREATGEKVNIIWRLPAAIGRLILSEQQPASPVLASGYRPIAIADLCPGHAGNNPDGRAFCSSS